MLLQEHHLADPVRISEAAHAARLMGCVIYFEPATVEDAHPPSGRQGTRGGIAVAIKEVNTSRQVNLRKGLDMEYVHPELAGRLCAATVLTPFAKDPITLVSAYFMAGAEATHANKDLLSLISDEVLSCTDTFVIGADWQSTPENWMDTGWHVAARAHYVHPCTELGTCLSTNSGKKAGGTIDFLAVVRG